MSSKIPELGCFLCLFQRNQGKPAVDSPVLDPVAAEPDELAALGQVFLEHGFRDLVVEHCDGNLAFPFVDLGEAFRHPAPLAVGGRLAVRGDHPPFPRYILTGKRQYDSLLNHYSRLEERLERLDPLAGAHAEACGRSVEHVLDSERLDDDVAFVVHVAALPPMRLLILLWVLPTFLGGADVRPERDGGERLEMRLVSSHVWLPLSRKMPLVLS